MRAIIAAGGTGGHIYPALAVADKIKTEQPDSEILFIGGMRGMEKTVVPERGYPIKLVDVRGFSRKQPHKNLGAAAALLKAGRVIKGILRDFRPDAVIGAGGYVSGPVVRTAAKCGHRAFIHEQNAWPGLANRLAERYAEKVFLAFEEGKKHFKDQSKLVVSGNPIRREFIAADGADCRKKLGAGENETVILCFGGSLGAGTLNTAFSDILEELHRLGDVRAFLITGTRYYPETLAKAAAWIGEGGAEDVGGASRAFQTKDGRVRLMEYADDIHEYMAASDLVIARSGALTVSEITACGKASILAPSPNVTGNHQYHNAKTVADKGGALIISEENLTGMKLLEMISRLKNDKEIIGRMSAASAALGRFDAADVIYEHIVGGRR
ncbi:MAG: undecaprenyldiphospho-muramoylpentapeptide beta-N-acetylglucosaminyltransferase [Clostridiales Family XIII bacterium]|jgi:UDP-N-acetylglucosamine--N-acetylmuramyl-(pentapeptide) pyrophosphoryl-undecaprenol N-acetylglucosamine transferase|nr:undecaprenyldiphospho-muramoylpentapeptide beta-N-acetylglucosaminyltransferase [Clostridiales Family XIII bacterium]